MAGRKYYVLCESNCKFESMTKEQILTAIQQAVETGEIKDVDTGFVTTIKEQNRGAALTFWIGTTAEYNAIEAKQEGCFYILTDDTAGEDLKSAIKELRENVESINNGIPPLAEIVVTARGGSVTCTDSNGENVNGIQIGNIWRFSVSKYGVYTLRGVYGALSAAKTVNVTTVQQYFETMEYYSDNFADNDWETIIDTIQRGVYPETWKVGDEKQILEKDGDIYNVCIIGKNHDTYEDGTKAPFTFGTCIGAGSDSYINITARIASSNGFEGLWSETEMYTTHIPAFVALLPAAVQNAMRAVQKSTLRQDKTTIDITNDKAFLLSSSEILSDGAEGAQYEYFKNGNMYRLNNTRMWTRTFNTNLNGNTYYEVLHYSSLDTASLKVTEYTAYYPAFCF